MPDWIERQLAHHLAPVEAPPALAFEMPAHRPPRRSFSLPPILATAAAVAFLLLAAPHEITNPAAINRYIQSRAGIDLAIPANTSANIERVRILEQNGARVAAVTYRAGNKEGTVLVARASAVNGADWKAHGRVYAVASTDPHIACVLCHANL